MNDQTDIQNVAAIRTAYMRELAEQLLPTGRMVMAPSAIALGELDQYTPTHPQYTRIEGLARKPDDYLVVGLSIDSQAPYDTQVQRQMPQRLANMYRSMSEYKPNQDKRQGPGFVVTTPHFYTLNCEQIAPNKYLIHIAWPIWVG